MIKVIYFFKRRPGMSVEDFQAHWRTTHADIIVALPGIRRYVQNHTLPSAYRKGEPAFDGVAESWFDDTQTLKALAATPQYAAVLADEPKFIDGPTMGSIITDEHVLKDGPAPAGGIKTVDLVTHKPGMPLDAFFKYWREDHGRLGAAAPVVRRYVQSHTRGSIYAAGRTPAYDAACGGRDAGVRAPARRCRELHRARQVTRRARRGARGARLVPVVQRGAAHPALTRRALQRSSARRTTGASASAAARRLWPRRPSWVVRGGGVVC